VAGRIPFCCGSSRRGNLKVAKLLTQQLNPLAAASDPRGL
jgi:hypothetical protein